MNKDKPIVALLYDFDKTLCTKDMQEYQFIPRLGMKAKEFWQKSNGLARAQGMDSVLAYMYTMIREAQSEEQPVRREDFVAMGKTVEFFPGVLDWFSRINAYGESQGVTIKHYIISSGLREIIEGSAISSVFDKIYACEFHYNASGVADWPKSVVNYTTKTQFLFRINKGVLDVSDDSSVNNYVEEDDRPVPFRNMIYFGDGMTDVPCMKLVYVNGGKSIAVYNRRKGVVAEELIRQGRVHYMAVADYREGKELADLVKAIIHQMAATNALVRKTKQQQDKLIKK